MKVPQRREEFIMLQRSVLVLATTLLATPAVAQDAADSWSDVKISDLLSTATVLDESGTLWSGEVVRLNAGRGWGNNEWNDSLGRGGWGKKLRW